MNGVSSEEMRGASSVRVRVIFLALIAALPFLPALIQGHVLVFRDHADYFLPLRQFTLQVLRSGHLPFWNPYNGLGEPWLGNPQTNVFYPPAWLFPFLPLSLAYNLFLWLHLFVAGWSAFRLFRRVGSVDAAWIGAASWMLCGPLLSLLDVENNLLTLAWSPLLIDLAIDRERSRPRRIALIAIVLSLMFLAGEPLLLAVSIVLAFCVTAFARRFAGVLEVGIAGALALALSAVQLLPFLIALGGSDRTAGLDRSLALREGAAPLDWITAVILPINPPSHLLRLSQGFIPSLYLSPVLVLAAVLSVVGWRKLSPTRKQIVVGCVVLFALATFLASAGRNGWATDLYFALHLQVSRYPARFLPFAAAAVVALGVIGFDVAFPRVTDQRKMRIAGVLGVLLLLVAARPFFKHADRASLGSDLLAHLPQHARFARSLPARQSMAEVDFKRRWSMGYLNLLEPRFDLSTPAPIVDRRFERLHDAALRGDDVRLDQFLTVAGLLSTKDLSGAGMVPVKSDGDVTLWRMPGALPMVTLWSGVLKVRTDADGLNARLQRHGESVRTASDIAPELSHESHLIGSLDPLFRDTNHVEFGFRTPRPVIAVLNHLDAPGWRVTIDGAPAEKLTIDGIFRGVVVPPGEHRIEWDYSPPFFVLSASVSMATLLLLVVVVWRTRSESSEVSP